MAHFSKIEEVCGGCGTSFPARDMIVVTTGNFYLCKDCFNKDCEDDFS
jgi:hypothetical protein